jgi:hypothetical protein
MATAGKIKAEYDATPYDARPSEILVDIIGLGRWGLRPLQGAWPSGARRLRERTACASAMSCGFKGREWFQDQACSMPNDDALIAELTAPTYSFTSTGKIQ